MKKKTSSLFLLHAVWQEHGDYKHRVTVSCCEKPEDMIEAFGRGRKEWSTTDDPYKIGWIGNSLVRVSVFKLEHSYPDSMWEQWRETKKEQRKAELAKEEREQDMKTLRALVDKYGFHALEILALSAE